MAEPVDRHSFYTADCYYPLNVINLEGRILVIAWYDPLKARVGLEFPANVPFPTQGVNSVIIQAGTVKTNLAPASLKEWDIRVKLQFGGDVVLNFDRQTFKFLEVTPDKKGSKIP